MRAFKRIIVLLTVILTALSCSTTRVLQDGQYRLAKNKITVSNDKTFNTGSLDAYLKQKQRYCYICGSRAYFLERLSKE